MQKIMVIGSCGAGKSTLAQQIAEKKNLPLLHLDQLHWKPNWVEVSQEEFEKAQIKALAGEKWVVDGNFASTFEIRIPRADTIIWLDLAMPICFYRVLKRIYKNHGKTRADMGEGCPERFDWDFLHYVATFPLHGRRRIVKKLGLLKTEKQRLIHLQSRKEVQSFLKNLG